MFAQEARLLRVRADEMTYQRNCCCGAVVLVIIGFFIVTFNVFLPHFITEIQSTDCSKLNDREKQGQFCNSFTFNSVGVFQTYVMKVDEYNQFLMINVIPQKSYFNKRMTVEKNLTIQLMVEEIRDDYFVTRVLNIVRTYYQVVTCDFQRTELQMCTPFTLLFLPQVNPGNYRITFKIMNMQEISEYMSGVELEGYQVNSDYYGKYVGLRYSFFVFSLILYAYYAYKYCKIPKGLRSFEQDYILFLVPALALFNNPLLYMNIVMPSKFSIFVSVICTVVFLSMLWLFWAALFERIYKENENRRCRTLQLWKISIAVIICVFFTVALCAAGWMYIQDPAFTFSSDYPIAYKVCYGITVALVSIFLGYLIVYGALVIRVWRTRIQRHKTIFAFSLGFILASVMMLYASVYNFESYNGGSVLIGVSVINLYVYLLVYFYTPGRETAKQLDGIAHDARMRHDVNSQYRDLHMPQEHELYSLHPEERLEGGNKLNRSTDTIDQPSRPPALRGPDDKFSAFQPRNSKESESHEDENEKEDWNPNKDRKTRAQPFSPGNDLGGRGNVDGNSFEI